MLQPNPILLGCPKSVQHPSRSCRALGPGSPKPQSQKGRDNPLPLSPKAIPAQHHGRNRRIYGRAFASAPRAVNFPRQTPRGSTDGAASTHLFWNSGMLKSLSQPGHGAGSAQSPLGINQDCLKMGCEISDNLRT